MGIHRLHLDNIQPNSHSFHEQNLIDIEKFLKSKENQEAEPLLWCHKMNHHGNKVQDTDSTNNYLLCFDGTRQYDRS